MKKQKGSSGIKADAVVVAPKIRNNNEGKKMFLMILPFLVLVFLFSYFPLHGWIYALFDYRAPLKLSQCEFVGLKWFTTLFQNKMQVQ